MDGERVRGLGGGRHGDEMRMRVSESRQHAGQPGPRGRWGAGPTARVLPQPPAQPRALHHNPRLPPATSTGGEGHKPPGTDRGCPRSPCFARQCPRRGGLCREGPATSTAPLPPRGAAARDPRRCLPRGCVPPPPAPGHPRATHTPAPAQAHAARAPWGHPERVEMLAHAPLSAKPPPHPPRLPLQHLPPRSALTHGPTRALLSHAPPPCTRVPLHTHRRCPHRGRAGRSVLRAPPCPDPLRLPWVPRCGSGAAFGHRLPAAAASLGLLFIDFGEKASAPALPPSPRLPPPLCRAPESPPSPWSGASDVPEQQ